MPMKIRLEKVFGHRSGAVGDIEDCIQQMHSDPATAEEFSGKVTNDISPSTQRRRIRGLDTTRRYLPLVQPLHVHG